MTSYYTTPGGLLPGLYPPVIASRDPTSTDIVGEDGRPYAFDQEWLNTSNQNRWVYVSARTWVLQSGGVIPPLLDIAVPTGTSPVSPTGAGMLTFTSSDATVTITGSANSIDFKLGGGAGFTWHDVTTATQTIAVQNGYVTDRGGGVTYTLPATATFGQEFAIVGKLGLWTVNQNANQQIVQGSSSTTVGVGGSVAATDLGDCMELVCITGGASTVWRIRNSVGSLTFV